MGKVKKEINQLTGDRLKQCRKAKGMTAEQLAEKMDVSVTAVSDWETGRTSLSSKRQTGRVQQLASILGVNPDFLTGKVGFPSLEAEEKARMDKAEEDSFLEMKRNDAQIELIKLFASLHGYEYKEADFSNLDNEKDYFEIKKRRQQFLTLSKSGKEKIILSDDEAIKVANVLEDNFVSLLEWMF